MKKASLFILSILMIFCFAGCKAVNGENSSVYFEEYEVVKEKDTQKVSAKKDNKTKTYKKTVKTPVKTETEKSEEPKTAAENINSEPEIAEKTESVVSDTTEIKEVSATEENVSQPLDVADESTPETEESESEMESAEPEIEKTKTITINGKTYTADFIKTEEKGRDIVYERKTNAYENMEQSLQLEYDFITDELLFARVETEETDKKITKDEAKKIADNFINQHTDISGYTFKEVSENEDDKNYCIIYSKYIDGYYSAQTVKVYVTFDGNVKRYYNNKFVFDGIDTNIKINIEKLNKKLDKVLKKSYGKKVKYNASHTTLKLDDNGAMAMYYSVKILETDPKYSDKNTNIAFAVVPLNNFKASLIIHETIGIAN